MCLLPEALIAKQANKLNRLRGKTERLSWGLTKHGHNRSPKHIPIHSHV